MTTAEMIEVPQHVKAMAKANRIRLRGVEIRREVRAGRMGLRTALAHPDLGYLRILDLLMDFPRIGRQRALKYLMMAGTLGFPVPEGRRLRDLPRTQRERLLETVPERYHEDG